MPVWRVVPFLSQGIPLPALGALFSHPYAYMAAPLSRNPLLGAARSCLHYSPYPVPGALCQGAGTLARTVLASRDSSPVAPPTLECHAVTNRGKALSKDPINELQSIQKLVSGLEGQRSASHRPGPEHTAHWDAALHRIGHPHLTGLNSRQELPKPRPEEVDAWLTEAPQVMFCVCVSPRLIGDLRWATFCQEVEHDGKMRRLALTSFRDVKRTEEHRERWEIRIGKVLRLRNHQPASWMPEFDLLMKLNRINYVNKHADWY